MCKTLSVVMALSGVFMGCAIHSANAQVISLSADAIVNDRQIGTSTPGQWLTQNIGMGNGFFGYSGQGIATAMTTYGNNHVSSELNLTNPGAMHFGFDDVQALSYYSDSFSFALANGLASSITPTSIQFSVHVDGNIDVPPDFFEATHLQIYSSNAADGLVGASTTGTIATTATLTQAINYDDWNITAIDPVFGVNFTSQSFAIADPSQDFFSIAMGADVRAFSTTNAYDARVNFSNTATLVGVTVLDQYGNPISGSNLIIHAVGGNSSYSFTTPTPEPGSLATALAFALTGVAGVMRQRKMKA